MITNSYSVSDYEEDNNSDFAQSQIDHTINDNSPKSFNFRVQTSSNSQKWNAHDSLEEKEDLAQKRSMFR